MGFEEMTLSTELTANKYQEKALKTAVYPKQNTQDGFEYTLFGMLGEAGEMANKYKKLLRKEETLTEENRVMLMDELGDVLWYAAAVAKELQFNLEGVMKFNLLKLRNRQATGTLKDHK